MSLKTVLVTEPIHPDGMALLERAPGIEIIHGADLSPADMAHAVSRARHCHADLRTAGGMRVRPAFDLEPLPRDNPFLKLANVIVSPHSAGSTRESGRRMAIDTVENSLAVFAGTLDPGNVFNPDG